MKRKFLPIIFCLAAFVSSQFAYRQEIKNYYLDKEEFEINGEIFTIKVHPKYFQLENKNNKLFTAKQYFPNGEEVTGEHRLGGRAHLIDPEAPMNIAKSFFSESELQCLKDAKCVIYISPAVSIEGDILETKIGIIGDGNCFFSIPPERIYEFDQAIRDGLKFRLEEIVHTWGFSYVQGFSIPINFKKKYNNISNKQ
jgi:hypothetical protein